MKLKPFFTAWLLWLYSTCVIAESTSVQTLTPQVMISFLQNAKNYAELAGKDVALKEFSKVNGRFTKGELYIYAYDFNGTLLAHGSQPELIGKNFLALKDEEGLDLIKSLMSKVEKSGLGTLAYQWQNPVTGTVMPKLGFVMKIDDSYWIGSGLYIHPQDQAAKQ